MATWVFDYHTNPQSEMLARESLVGCATEGRSCVKAIDGLIGRIITKIISSPWRKLQFERQSLSFAKDKLTLLTSKDLTITDAGKPLWFAM